MNVLLIGSNGQVGSFLEETFKSFFPDSNLISVDETALNLADTTKIQSKLASFGRLDGILNAAAYTAVDQAEEDRDLAEKINHHAVREIALYAKRENAWLVHFSTDYVYEGTGVNPQLEDTPIHPVNFYGETKARGDAALQEINPKHLIFRTSWVYSERGKNFLLTMLRLYSEKTHLSVVSDQYGAPTYARDLADETLKALAVALASPAFPSGVYHLTNTGSCSWFEFADAILENLEELGAHLKILNLASIPASEYPTRAKRPHNSRLSMYLFKKTFGFEARPWRAALNDCMKKLPT